MSEVLQFVSPSLQRGSPAQTQPCQSSLLPGTGNASDLFDLNNVCSLCFLPWISSTVYWRYLSCSHCFHPGYLVLKMITISPRINFFPTYDFGLTKLPLSTVTSISRADPFWQWALQLLPPLVKPIANAFWSSSNALDRWANWMKQHYLVSSHLVHFTLIFFCSRICCHSY